MSKQMLLMELVCPQCGAALTDGTRVRLDAQVRETNQEGEMVLSAIFGDYTVETDLRLQEGWVVDFRCPRCESSLMLALGCKPRVHYSIQEGKKHTGLRPDTRPEDYLQGDPVQLSNRSAVTADSCRRR